MQIAGIQKIQISKVAISSENVKISMKEYT